MSSKLISDIRLALDDAAKKYCEERESYHQAKNKLFDAERRVEEVLKRVRDVVYEQEVDDGTIDSTAYLGA